jgi:hypothetical protein
MSPLVRYSFRFILLLLLQYLLSNLEPLGRFITPYIYFIYILWLPFSLSRFWLMTLAFVYGMGCDFLLLTPGLHAAACVLIAYFRSFLINVLLPGDAAEINYTEPSVKSMGLAPYAVYVLVLTFIHHAYMVFLQWLDVGSTGYFLIKVILTTAVSLLLITAAELAVTRKQKTRSSLRET